MSTVRTQHERISEGAEKVLSAVKTLGSRYGMNYLIDVLRGTPRFGLREESHSSIPAFGSMESSSPDYLRRLIWLLTRESYLAVSDYRFGLLGITERGEAYLQEPAEATFKPSALRMSALDRELDRRLRELRKEFAAKEARPPFRVFTDFCLQEIVEAKPETVADLLNVPGMGPGKCNQYGPAIVACIRDLQAHRDQFYRERLRRRALQPAHQAVKALFEAGLSLEQMAKKRAVKPETIQQALIMLHRAGEIDLKPWIEQNVPDEALEAGTTWFLNQESQRLRDAYETVGLDYDILRLCKLYVADLRSGEEQLAQAS